MGTCTQDLKDRVLYCYTWLPQEQYKLILDSYNDKNAEKVSV